jgi:catechol 2,3-dioxygenase-like lactoylglutathione lyase family enzyme
VLGRFLEYSIPTADIRASLDFYVRLGFSQAQVGETWGHAYAVVTDGRLHLGLHQLETAVPAFTFVKPDVLGQLDGLERRGVVFEYRKLGNDVFNEVGWLDPSGHLIRLIEARTFSPVEHPRGSLCGYFLEIALAVTDRELAKQYWERLGFVGLDEPDAVLPHVSCTSDSIDIGLYDPAQLRLPSLVFDSDDVKESLARLAGAGIAPSGLLPAPLRHHPAALLMAPEGTPILLLSA